jgi:hypothetical protein
MCSEGVHLRLLPLLLHSSPVAVGCGCECLYKVWPFMNLVFFCLFVELLRHQRDIIFLLVIGYTANSSTYGRASRISIFDIISKLCEKFCCGLWKQLPDGFSLFIDLKSINEKKSSFVYSISVEKERKKKQV